MPLVAIAGWAVVLWLPAVELSGGPAYTGFAILTMGWRAVRLGIVAWYANPLFIASTVLFGTSRLRMATLLAALALLLAMTSFAARPLAAAAGTVLPRFDFKVGFHLWLVVISGFFLVCLGALAARGKATRQAKRKA